MSNDNPQKKQKAGHLVQQFETNRRDTAASVAFYKFNKNRVRLLKELNDVKQKCKGILYWMIRDLRVQDNWALLFAQRTALKNRLPLHVCYCVPVKFLDTTQRHYKFLIKGLKEVENECQSLNIKFHLLHGQPNAAVLDFIDKYDMGALIADFFPLKLPRFWLEDVAKKLSKDIPACQVDAHNIVPCWHTSSKQEYSARTIRSKIHKSLESFLTEFPPVVKHAYKTKETFEENDWENIWKHVEVDESVSEITWAKPGYTAGVKEFERFLNERLPRYHADRNNPLKDALSNLSPWFHFGMISVQRCILEVNKYRKLYKESVESFIEEAVVRRELSDNFCYYNSNYDTILGASKWSIDTLTEHKKDKRKHVYTLEQMERAEMHDKLWNACQNQMVRHGKMHGYLRMYWAKKILEYSQTPEQALEWSIYLNNRYSIDGADPNGYVGCMWSICGVHDQGWRERDVFGKIRYMNYEGCARKFNVDEFIAKWNG